MKYETVYFMGIITAGLFGFVFASHFVPCVNSNGFGGCFDLVLNNTYVTMTIHLLTATIVGGLIGMERTMHGRPAGIRTHMLVCLSSALLALVTVFQLDYFPQLTSDVVRIDPSRMAQGIMTGIGFLGAGVIIKEFLTIRGLTTAASLWTTAAIGIMIGLGFFYAGILATVLTLSVLAVVRYIESKLPAKNYAKLSVTTSAIDSKNVTITEEQLEQIVIDNEIDVKSGFKYDGNNVNVTYEITICSNKKDNFIKLANTLGTNNNISRYTIIPVGD